ncbi:MAG: hypothetical protein WBN72_10500 [Nitrososphaeraceae archaeon]
MVAATTKSIRMVTPVAGIIMSVDGLSTEKKCSKFSYMRNAQNRENITMAYFNLMSPVFMYVETDNAIKTAANNVATTYRINSVRS